MGVSGLIPALLRIIGNFRHDLDLNKFDNQLQGLLRGNKLRYFCLDLPGEIHTACSLLFSYGEYAEVNRQWDPTLRGTTMKEILKELAELGAHVAIYVCERIIKLARLFRPAEIVIAMDGPVSAAKMAQQRARRYAASQHPQGEFDTNNITAGTPFMKGFERKLLALLQQNTELPTIHFFKQEIFGEGEHKIIEFLRDHPDAQAWDIILGTDTDLLLLAATLSSKTLIFRERFHQYLDVPTFVELLTAQNIDANQLIFALSVVGNDFLPHHDLTTDRAYAEGVIELILQFLAKQKHPRQEALVWYLDNVLTVDWQSFAGLFQELADYEAQQLPRYGAALRKQNNASYVYQERAQIEEQWYYREIFHGQLPQPSANFNLIEIRYNMIEQYFKGLLWIYQYYESGPLSSSNAWSYPYTYPPMWQHISDYLAHAVSSEEGATVWFSELVRVVQSAGPFYDHKVHLLTVLPTDSWKIIPNFTDNLRIRELDWALFANKISIGTADLLEASVSEKHYLNESTYYEIRTTDTKREHRRVFVPYLSPREVGLALGIIPATTTRMTYETYPGTLKEYRNRVALIRSYIIPKEIRNYQVPRLPAPPATKKSVPKREKPAKKATRTTHKKVAQKPVRDRNAELAWHDVFLDIP